METAPPAWLNEFSLCCPKGCGPLLVTGVCRCPACGSAFGSGTPFLDFVGDLAPAPAGLGPRMMHSDLLVRIYERWWRPAFVTLMSAGRNDVEREFQSIQRALAPARGGLVVDLSCGPGLFGRRLAQSGIYRQVAGLDFSAPMLQKAHTYAQDAGLSGFPLLRADVARQPFADASLDGAHAGAALHLWPDVPAALREISRTLRPGAPFVASTFFLLRSPALRRLQRRAGESITTTIFDETALRQEVERAGFTDFTLRRRAAWGRLRAVKAPD